MLSLGSREEAGNWKDIYLYIYVYIYVYICTHTHTYIYRYENGWGWLALFALCFPREFLCRLMPRECKGGAHKWRSVMLMRGHTNQPHIMVQEPGYLLLLWGKMFISEAQRDPFHQLELGLDQPPEKAVSHCR